eukprot:1740836-Rhodomonas_salina.3
MPCEEGEGKDRVDRAREGHRDTKTETHSDREGATRRESNTPPPAAPECGCRLCRVRACGLECERCGAALQCDRCVRLSGPVVLDRVELPIPNQPPAGPARSDADPPHTDPVHTLLLAPPVALGRR